MTDMQNAEPACGRTEDDNAQVKQLHETDLYTDHVADTTLAEVEKLTCVLTGKPVRDLVRDFVIAKIGSDVPHDDDKTEHASSRHKSSKHKKKKKKKKSKHSHKEKSPKCCQHSRDKIVTSPQHGSCLQGCDDISSNLVSSFPSTIERVEHKECSIKTLKQVSVNCDEATISLKAATTVDKNHDNFIKVSNSNDLYKMQVESVQDSEIFTGSSVGSNGALMVVSKFITNNDAPLDSTDKKSDVNCHNQKHSIEFDNPSSTSKTVLWEPAVCVENFDNGAVKSAENSKKINSYVISSGAECKKNEHKPSNESKSKREKHSPETKRSRSRSRHKSLKKTRKRSRSKERHYVEKSVTSSNECSQGKLKDWHHDRKRDKKNENVEDNSHVIERKSKEKKLEGINQDTERKSKEKFEKLLGYEEGRKYSEAVRRKDENKGVIDLEKKSTRELHKSSHENKESNGCHLHSSRHSTRERSYDDEKHKQHSAANKESIRDREHKKIQDISLNNKNTEDNGKKRQIRCNKQRHRYSHSDDTTEDDSPPPQQRARLDARSLKESSVIQVSDDDADVMSDHMMETLHKRLTTSLKKSKELQAEKEMGLCSGAHLTIAQMANDTVIDVESFGVPESEFERGVLSNKANTDIVCLDSNNITSSIPDIPMPASPIQPTACSVLQVTVADEAVKSDNGKSVSKPLGKKSGLKFGLKITESSAALISLGVKGETGQSSQGSMCEYIFLFLFD